MHGGRRRVRRFHPENDRSDQSYSLNDRFAHRSNVSLPLCGFDFLRSSLGCRLLLSELRRKLLILSRSLKVRWPRYCESRSVRQSK
jgi:hypothetical protein